MRRLRSLLEHHVSLTPLALLLSKIATCQYVLVDDYNPSNFFDKMTFFTDGDPTNGYVQYVNRTVAQSNGYIQAYPNHVYIGVDTVNTYLPDGRGRPSVRVSTNNSWTKGLWILDLNHMPWGCGTWPAWWTLGPNWPTYGEIDIIEGANIDKTDGMALHTSDNCTVAGNNQTGVFKTNNCYWLSNGNLGCGSVINNTLSYGQGFNQNGGGTYAMEWTSNWIRIWFFPRGYAPASITGGTPDPTEFGIPAGNWQGNCNIDAHFRNHTTVFDNTFCGDYAGNTYGSTTCPQYFNTSGYNSCKTFVGQNPSNFTETYWSINWMRIYQNPAYASSTSQVISVSSATPSDSVFPLDIGLGNTGSVSSAPPDISSTISVIPTSAYQGPNTLSGKSMPEVADLPPSPLPVSNSDERELKIRALSVKRGLIYIPNELHPEDDQIWIQPGSDLTWYYNYGWQPSSSHINSSLLYVPMLWGAFNSTFNADIRAMVAAGASIPYILSYNEPDISYQYGGSNVDPLTAANFWMRNLEPLHQDLGVALGAPACSGSQGGFTWLQQFFTACAGRCSTSFLPLHWYGDFQGLASHIGQARATYPNMTIWLTEFALPNSDLLSSQTFFNQSTSYMDRLDYVDRYSYFGSFRSDVSNVGPNATMLDANGALTDIGIWYLNVAANTSKATVSFSLPSSTSITRSSSQIATSQSTFSTAPTATTVTCPDSNSTTYFNLGASYVVECFIDRGAGNLPGSPVQVASFAACMDACTTTPGCQDVSFVNGNGATRPCYLHDRISSPSNASNVFGARLVSGGTPSGASTSLGFSSSSSLLSMSSLPSAPSTSVIASPTSAVSSSSSSAISNTTSSTVSSAPVSSSTSYVCPAADGTLFSTANMAIFRITCDMDHQGGDIGAANYVSDFPACMTLCSATPGCVAVGFRPGSPAGPCYVKNIVGGNVTSPGVYGAVCVAGCSLGSASSFTSTMPSSSPPTLVSSPVSMSSVVLGTGTITSSLISPTGSSQMSSSAISPTSSMPTSSSSAISSATYSTLRFSGSSSISTIIPLTSQGSPSSSSSTYSYSTTLTQSSVPTSYTDTSSRLESSLTSIEPSSPALGPSFTPSTPSPTELTETSGSSFLFPTAFPTMWPPNVTIVCPAANDTGYIAPGGSLFGIRCFEEYDGTDLKRRSSSRVLDNSADTKRAPGTTDSLNDCISACEANPLCVAVSWVADTPGYCYLKASIDFVSPMFTVWAAYVVRRARPTVSGVASTSTLPNAFSSIGSPDIGFASTVTIYSNASSTVTVTTTVISSPTISQAPTTPVALCYTCGLTPTVVTSSTGSYSASMLMSTCKIRPRKTVTVCSTTTVLSCPTPLTCPANGYIWHEQPLTGSRKVQGSTTITSVLSSSTLAYTTVVLSALAIDIPPPTSSSAQGLTVSTQSPTFSVTGSDSNPTPNCPNEPPGRIWVDPLGMQYALYCNSIFPNSPFLKREIVANTTIAEELQDSFAACISACDVYNIMHFYGPPPCLGVSWIGSDYDLNCLLKGDTTDLETLVGVDSAKLLTPYNLIGNQSTTIVPSSTSTSWMLSSTNLGPTRLTTGLGMGPGTGTGTAPGTGPGTGPGGATIIVTGGGFGTGPGTGVATITGGNNPGATATVTGGGGNPGATATIVGSGAIVTVVETETILSVLTITTGGTTIISTVYTSYPVTVTVPGPTQTIVDVSISQAPVSIVTVTAGGGGTGGGGGVVTVIVTQTVQSSKAVSTSSCRTTPTQYLRLGEATPNARARGVPDDADARMLKRQRKRSVVFLHLNTDEEAAILNVEKPWIV